MGTFLTACITYVLNIICNITEYFKNKSKDQTITNNENSRKFQEEVDKHTSVVNDAIKTKDLDELRKEASE